MTRMQINLGKSLDPVRRGASAPRRMPNFPEGDGL